MHRSRAVWKEPWCVLSVHEKAVHLWIDPVQEVNLTRDLNCSFFFPLLMQDPKLSLRTELEWCGNAMCTGWTSRENKLLNIHQLIYWFPDVPRYFFFVQVEAHFFPFNIIILIHTRLFITAPAFWHNITVYSIYSTLLHPYTVSSLSPTYT